MGGEIHRWRGALCFPPEQNHDANMNLKSIKINSKIFIAGGIIVLILLGILGTFVVIDKFRSYQREQSEKNAQATENLALQQKTLDEARQEIEKLKSENKNIDQKIEQKSNELSRVVAKAVQNNSQQGSVESTIQASEINQYLSGVGEIICYGDVQKSGSASLWKFGNDGYVLTNYHVISGPGNCNLTIDGNGVYKLDKTSVRSWNSATDVAVVKIAPFGEMADISSPISELNYSISYLKECPAKMPLGSPVIAIGFPAYSRTTTMINGVASSHSQRTITNGIISAYDDSVQMPIGSLPNVNYFVSAKIDSGNSGGITFSKNENGLCLLGIPTWLSLGKFEAGGLIQNIFNVLYEK